MYIKALLSLMLVILTFLATLPAPTYDFSTPVVVQLSENENEEDEEGDLAIA